MYRILFTIGSFPIYAYGVMIALAFIVGILMAMQEAKKTGEDPERILDLSLYIILGAIIGGRLGYVIFHLDYYLKNPVQIFYFREGGLALLGGFVLAFILGRWHILRNKLSFWKYADIIAPSLAFGYGIARIGCFLNGCCFGVVSEKCGIRFPALNMPPVYLRQLQDGLIAPGSPYTLPVIPTQIYASLSGFLIFLILIRLKKYKKYEGFIFLNLLLLYSLYRFIIEFFRFYESGYLFLNLTVGQVICIGLALGSLIFMNILNKRNKEEK